MKWLDPHFSELHPTGVAFGAVGLDGEVAGSKMLCEAFGVLVVDNFLAVEPDLDMRTDCSDPEGIPDLGLTELVPGISLVEPVAEIESDRFPGSSTTDINLKTIALLFRMVAKIDAAIVFAVFVDLKVQDDFKVLKRRF